MPEVVGDGGLLVDPLDTGRDGRWAASALLDDQTLACGFRCESVRAGSPCTTGTTAQRRWPELLRAAVQWRNRRLMRVLLRVQDQQPGSALAAEKPSIDRLCRRYTGQAGRAEHRLRPQPAGSRPDHPDAGLPAGSDAAGLPASASTGFSIRRCSRGCRARSGAHDVVHCHTPNPLRRTAGCRRTRAPPRRWRPHHADAVRYPLLRAPYALLQRAFYARMDRVVATSAAYVETSPTLQRLADKVQHHPHRHQRGRTSPSLQPGDERRAWASGSRRPSPCMSPRSGPTRAAPTPLAGPIRGTGHPAGHRRHRGARANAWNAH